MKTHDQTLLEEAYKKTGLSEPTMVVLLKHSGDDMSSRAYVLNEDELMNYLERGTSKLVKAWKLGTPLNVHNTPIFYSEQPTAKKITK